MSDPLDLVGKYAECVTEQGDLYAKGKVVSYIIGPVYGIETADGERISWREHLVREIPKPSKRSRGRGKGREHNRDLAHAVALEREAIAAWLEEIATEERRQADLPSTSPAVRVVAKFEATALDRAAQAIRSGAHNQGSEGEG